MSWSLILSHFISLENFKEELADIFKRVRQSKLGSVNVGELLFNILQVVARYKVRLKPNVATLVVGTIVLEGIGTSFLDLITCHHLSYFATQHFIVIVFLLKQENNWTPISIFWMNQYPFYFKLQNCHFGKSLLF